MNQAKQSLWIFLGGIALCLGFLMPLITATMDGGPGADYVLSANGFDMTRYGGPILQFVWILPASGLVVMLSGLFVLLTPPSLSERMLLWQKIVQLIAGIAYLGGVGYFLIQSLLGGQILASIIRQAIAVGCHPEADIPCYETSALKHFGIGVGTFVIALGLIACANALYFVKGNATMQETSVESVSDI